MLTKCVKTHVFKLSFFWCFYTFFKVKLDVTKTYTKFNCDLWLIVDFAQGLHYLYAQNIGLNPNILLSLW